MILQLCRMVKSSASSPATPSFAKKGGSPAKRSPAKAYKPLPVMMAKKNTLRLSVISFGEPFSFELYFYERSETDDGYTHGITKQIRGEGPATHDLFDSANFVQQLTRRIPGSDDVALKNSDGKYDRRLFLRYPPERESTAETRAAGLNALKAFLMHKTFSTYPASEIEVRDLTDIEGTVVATPMDNYMMNKDIQAAIIQDCKMDELNANFREQYPDTAERLWQSSHVGEFGRSLGF